MNIDDKKYTVSILVLLMEHEVEVTLLTLQTLLKSLEDGVTVSVLLNGGSDIKLRNLCGTQEPLHYYEKSSNIGVAGGRNFLMKTPECRSADIVMILDNDVIPPQDYVRNLATFLVRTPDAGVVGGVTADFNAFSLADLGCYEGQGIWGDKTWFMQSEDIKCLAVSHLKPETFFHLGGHPDYYYTYFSSRRRFKGLVAVLSGMFGKSYEYQPILKYNKKYLGIVSEHTGSYVVSNVAGCSQAFTNKLVDRIGYLNEMFNPYGFEDTDFCIRAIKAGFTNYIDLGTWLLHGSDSRHSGRTPERQMMVLFRGLTILTAMHYPRWRFRFIIAKLCCLELLASALVFDGKYWRRVKSILKGVREGLKVIGASRNNFRCVGMKS